MRSVERLQGGADDRVRRKPGDRRLDRGLDGDPVAEIDPLVDGRELVVAVLTAWPDDERQIDLRRRGAGHVSASASATNSGGVNASARTLASRPIVASASTARSRVTRPESDNELASVLRR